MIRGTTPTHTYTLPFDTSMVQSAKIIYAQNGEMVFCKSGDAVSMSGNEITCKLTQEETLALDCSKIVEIQLRILTSENDALASDIMRASVGRCLDSEVL